MVGVVECPEEDCGAEYRYSWCGNDLCDDENRPRYHCPICKCCGDHRDQHCEVIPLLAVTGNTKKNGERVG